MKSAKNLTKTAPNPSREPTGVIEARSKVPKNSPLIYIVDDDELFARCLAKYCSPARTLLFSNVIDVINSIDSALPDLIFLDILLTGPDAFTLLNELVSYPDTAAIPIVIVSSLDFKNRDLSAYGVVACLTKDTLTPKEVCYYVNRYSH